MAKNQAHDKGKVQIANDVVAAIAATAALEIEGVYAMGAYTGGIAVFVRKNMNKGVKVTMAGHEVVLDLNIVIRFGYRILEVSENVQSRVHNAVQTMTGLSVQSVNVVVSSVYLEKEAPAPKPSRKDKDTRKDKPEEKQPETTAAIEPAPKAPHPEIQEQEGQEQA